MRDYKLFVLYILALFMRNFNAMNSDAVQAQTRPAAIWLQIVRVK